MATHETRREYETGVHPRGRFPALLLAGHARTLLIGVLAMAVLVAALGSEAFGSAQQRPAFLVALALVAVLLGDNVFNIWSSARRHDRERLFIENEFIEAQAKLDLLVRWLEGIGVRIDLDQLAVQALSRQMSARHVSGSGPRDAAEDAGPDTVA